MGTAGNNLLGLLRELAAQPQQASAALKILEASTAGWEKDSQVMREHTAEVLKSMQAQQNAVVVFSRWHNQSQMAVAPLRQMQEALRTLGPEFTTATVQAEQHANAVQRTALALRSQTTAEAELANKGLAGLIAGRKAQAGVEAVWETARGIALLAEGTWPPNPAAILAAGLHFEAAAQYALLAGTGARHRGGAGAGYGVGGERSALPQEGGALPSAESAALAPGAAGAGARFSGSGVVIIRGTQEFENYVATAVNSAVARGITVTATQSQRGAPVGH
jgi:hypothetical protein